MRKVPLCALLLSCNLACSRSALDDNLGQALASGGRTATSTTPRTAAGGSYAIGGSNQGGTGGIGTLGGMGNTAGTAPGGAAGAAPLCKTNDFFGERLLPTVNYTGSMPAQLVTTLDVNGDQWPDLVLGQETQLSVFLGAGKGEFSPRQEISYWYKMTSPVATDLNKDGYRDIVVVLPGSGLRSFMGQPDGVDDYASSVFTPSLNYPRLLAAGDLDANGADELVVSDGNTHLTVLVGATVGSSFTAGPSIALQSPIESLRVADVNGDKALDLVTLGPTGGIVAYLGIGDGTFEAGVATAYSGTPTSLSLGSLNGDKYPDLLTTDGASIMKWLGHGDGSFALRSTSLGVAAVAAEIVDLNADGFNDIVAADATSGRLCIWQGSNDMASWPDPFCPTILVDPSALGIADFDRDGTTDVVVSSKTMPSLILSWGGPERRRTTDSRLQKFDMGTSTVALAVADFSADGILDVVTAPVDAAHLKVTLGTGNGQFAYGRLVYTDGPARALATADFDNDGVIDLCAITTKNSLVISRRDQEIVVSLPLGKPFDLMAVSDLNKDGHLDVVLVEKGSTSGATLLGQGRSTFTWGKGFASARPIEGIAVGDLDGDGIPDLALATKPSVVEVSQGVGDGSFAKSNQFSGGGGSGIRIADFNEDGIPDLVAGSDYAAVSLLPGKGDLSFDFSTSFFTGVPARDLVVADFDGDGHLDVLASDLQSMVLGLALGRGDGTFPYTFEFLVGVVPAQLAVGDLNRDGRIDLVMRSQNATTFSRLLNLCR